MPLIGRAGWKMCFNQSEAIWVVTCHQYRISALVSQTAFRESQSWRPKMSSKPDKNSLLYLDFQEQITYFVTISEDKVVSK